MRLNSEKKHAFFPFWFLIAGIALNAFDSVWAQEKLLAAEEVVVVGKRPGPPLWRVENGEHTLWIFGTLLPLPKSLQWDSTSVDAIMSQTEVYIAPPSISASTANPFTAFNTLRKIRKLERLSKSQTLESILPKPLYERLMTIKSGLAPKNKKIFRMRPMIAAERLAEMAYRTAGLTNEDTLTPLLEKQAKKFAIPIIHTQNEIELKQVFKIFSNIPIEAELDCVTATLDSISSDLDASILRALAWSDGDASALKAMDYPDVNAQCTNVLLQGDTGKAAYRTSRNKWLTAASNALKQNFSSFSSLPIRELVSPDGLLAKLQQEGFTIRSD